MERAPAVAGQFYPGDKEELRRTIQDLIPNNTTPKKKVIAAISPHAGYVYSGGVAAQTFSHIDLSTDIIIIGPNHHGYGSELAIMAEGIWQMPMGPVKINDRLAQEIMTKSDVFTDDQSAHLREHSLEVQVPFLQYFKQDLKIVPICASHIPFTKCQKAGEALAAAIKDWPHPVTMVASTDMTHYETRETAFKKDHLALKCIEKLDPAALYKTVIEEKISMCGFIPTVIVMIAANLLSANQAELVRYTDSGEASGNTRQVVGYAGLLIS